MRCFVYFLAAVAVAMAVMGLRNRSGSDFPDHPVRIVVPFPAGGSNDVVARFLGMRLSEVWGQPVIIDNRAGAGGNIGAEMVARSAPDGYTLLLTAPGPLAVNQSLYPHLTFDPRRILRRSHWSRRCRSCWRSIRW